MNSDDKIVALSSNGKPLPYPGAEQNLRPVTKGSDAARILGQKGGESKSIAKSEAIKLMRIKNRIKKDFPLKEDVEWLEQKLNDRPSMAADLLISLEKMKKEGVHPMQRIAFLNTEATILKATHGEKIKTENVNINVNTNIEEWERRIAETFENEVSSSSKEQ